MKQEITDVLGCEGKDGGPSATVDLWLFLEMESIGQRETCSITRRHAQGNSALSEDVSAEEVSPLPCNLATSSGISMWPPKVTTLKEKHPPWVAESLPGLWVGPVSLSPL